MPNNNGGYKPSTLTEADGFCSHGAWATAGATDRILPNGWCMLPPLQTCDKGNACLTCSVFVTDGTHQDVLQRQLRETQNLIVRATTEFEQRHSQTMPEDNVWLTRRRAEHHALTELLAALDDTPDSATHGTTTECHRPNAGPVPLTLDLTRHRRSPR